MSGMNIYSKRLNSFRPKRRPSSASTNKPPPMKWPHDRPSAKTLAAAGLYYNPSEDHPDNVTCYLCAKDLDGWESDDDPSAEHVKHCPDCGWARVSVTSTSTSTAEDPRGARMVRARADTFGDWWPHEGKLGWAPSVHRMAEAGWHYSPTKDSDDFANCAYCDLSLDGWEPTDDPIEEHRRRSPNCAFFTWTPPRQPTRKTSRASMQSVMANSDDEPVTKPTKKAPRAKKSKKAEPEPDNVFEDAPRGRKRTSTAAQQGPVVMYDGTISTEEEVGHEQQQPAQKKRATRASLAAQQLSRDAKMNADSDNESIASVASRTGVKPKAKAKKPAARRNSKVRGNSVARKTKAQPAIPSDDELDRALALDLERPLTDEEEGFKDFKKPFIRPMKRITRSRASLAVEEKMRNAPPDSILNSTTKGGRGRTPAVADVDRSPTKSPSKKFFRESSQDFSIPVRVPKHLAVEDDLQEVKSPERRNLEDDFAGDTIKVAARDITDTEMEMEIEVKPKKAPAKKAARGRKKKDAAETVTATEDEPEAPKPKRGKAAKKAASTRERESNVTVDSVQEKIELQLYQEQEERPQKGRKRLVRGTRPKRESVISIASTVETEPEPAQSFMDIDHQEEEPAETSDAGSVIRHDVADTLYPTLAPSPEPQAAEAEAEVEMEEEAAEPTPKPTKKTANPTTKRSTRSSAVSTASTTISSIAGSHLNSDSDNTPRQKGRKPTKKQQARQRKTKDDALKKGSESFFNSAQNEEMKGRKGRRTRSSMMAAEAEEEDTVRDSTTKGRSSSPAFVTPGDDVHMSEAAHAAEERTVSDNHNDDDLSATDIDPHSTASSPAPETEASTDRPVSPRAPAPTRMPLSPVRRGMNIPLATAAATTPKAHPKVTALHSRKPWVAVDLDTVFAHGSEESDEGAGVLTAREREMTVAEWVKWNAAQAEGRMKGEGERIVALFEACGRRAREAIEAIETVD
ncbi:uncharacterized protein H6S33_004332 [Morchella sextelata]|uniref:uncharacterized protein n=1 Tax=Morchella sextelata TaxID=1174677 RepID=UPI001D036C9E|nr:uncharacterized protein H6S33_004332 [Morchella sextelata]KAH0605875.1 hypothetical protein H6S33_004332 [Morchella sextelata]